MWEEDYYPVASRPSLESDDTPVEGRVYTMYHGTTRKAAVRILKKGFRPSSGMFGPGVYLSRNPEKARRYPLGLNSGRKRVVLVVRVDVGKVIAINYQNHPKQKTWHSEGYDTAWSPPNCGMVSSGLEEDCVWDPKRVEVMGVLCPKGQPSAMWEQDDYPVATRPRLKRRKTPVEGRVYTMYHGTTRKAAVSILQTGFKPSSGGMFGPGVYLSRNPEKARKYPLGLSDREKVVLIVRVDVGKVIAINYQNHHKQKTWHTEYGFDTAWCPPKCGMVSSGLEEDCVWDPKRVEVMGVLCPKIQPNGMWVEDLFRVEPRLKSRRQLDDNKVYIMYHGTSKEYIDSIQRTGFRRSIDGMLGPGVYLSRDLKKASRYPLDVPVNRRVVLRVRVEVGKVKKIDSQHHPMRESWHSYGYDTAWCPPECGMVRSGLEEDCVWDPSRIKVTRVIQPNLNNF